METRLRGIAAATACAWALVSGAAWAQDKYPSRPIRLVIPFAPGGGSDVTARLLGPRLAERLGQPVVIDNRPAASGVVGADIVAKAGVFRFDGSDLMPKAVGSGTFWSELIKWENGQSSQQTADNIEKSWPTS